MTQAICDFLQLTSQCQLHQASFCLPNYAHILKLLNSLLSNAKLCSKLITWNEKAKTAFADIKQTSASRCHDVVTPEARYWDLHHDGCFRYQIFTSDICLSKILTFQETLWNLWNLLDLPHVLDFHAKSAAHMTNPDFTKPLVMEWNNVMSYALIQLIIQVVSNEIQLRKNRSMLWSQWEVNPRWWHCWVLGNHQWTPIARSLLWHHMLWGWPRAGRSPATSCAQILGVPPPWAAQGFVDRCKLIGGPGVWMWCVVLGAMVVTRKAQKNGGKIVGRLGCRQLEMELWVGGWNALNT